MLSNDQIIKQFYGDHSKRDGHKHISEDGLHKQKKEDALNQAFFDGDKSSYTYELSAENKKFAVCFNRVRPYVHSFMGFAAQNRRNPEYFAIETDDQKRGLYTETANKMLAWSRSNANADQVETAQDKQLGIRGYGAVAKDIDYMENPDGVIKYLECSDDYWWDPASHASGLDDRRWEFLKKKIHVDEALKRFGGKEEDYEAAATKKFDNFQYWPEGGSYDKISYDWVGSSEPNMVYVYEYHWYDLEEYWRVFNPIYDERYQMNGMASALLEALDRAIEIRMAEAEEDDVEDLFSFDPRKQTLSLTREQYKDFKAIAERLGIEFDSDVNLRKVFCEAVLSGNKVFKKRKSIDQSGFGVKVKTADYDPKNKLWHGMVSSLREPSKYANAAITKFLLILASTSGPGYFYDLHRVEDPSKFEKEAALNAKAIAVEGNPNEVVRDKQQPVLPNGFETLYPVFLQALSDVIGFAPEAMGMGDLSQPSFELEQQRIKQVMTTLAVYFDAITLYQKEDAKSLLYYQRRLVKNKEGRTVPFVDEDGTQSVAKIFSDMIAEEYTIDIGEAPDTPTKKKEQGLVMQGFADKVALAAPQLAKDAYALTVEHLPISIGDKAKWRNLLTTPVDPQAGEREAEVAELQRVAALTELEKTQSETAKNVAQAEKTRAEVEKVEAETNQTDLENLAISTNPIHEVNINI